jgi:hypothetical protein
LLRVARHTENRIPPTSEISIHSKDETARWICHQFAKR